MSGTLHKSFTLTTNQPKFCRTFSIFGCFACDFGITATSGHLCFSQNWQGKNWVLNFSWRFRRFSANKSSKQNAETEQARPQLYFAQKIIKIHLVVLENELIEVCMLISKHCQKLSRVCHALLCVLLIKRTFTKVSIHIHNLSCMKALHTVVRSNVPPKMLDFFFKQKI